jgi:hypothetical protein
MLLCRSSIDASAVGSNCGYQISIKSVHVLRKGQFRYGKPRWGGVLQATIAGTNYIVKYGAAFETISINTLSETWRPYCIRNLTPVLYPGWSIPIADPACTPRIIETDTDYKRLRKRVVTNWHLVYPLCTRYPLSSTCGFKRILRTSFF